MALYLHVPSWEQYKSDPQVRTRMNNYFRNAGWQISGDVQYQDQYENTVNTLQKTINWANQQEVLSGGAENHGFSAQLVDKAMQAGLVSGTLTPDKNFYSDIIGFLSRAGGGVNPENGDKTSYSWLKSPTPYTPTPGGREFQAGDTKESGGSVGLNASGGGGTRQGGAFPDSANKMLDVLQEHLTNGIINPDVTIDQGTVDSYLKQAKEELAPYYKQLFDQASQDLQSGFKQIGEDVAANERNLEQKYGTSLQNTQENMARRGLTDSSIRNTAENNLASSTQAAIEAGRKEAERRALDLGTKGERYLGSSNLPTLPGITSAPTPILNQPGVYSFSKPTSTRDLFAPVGNTTGTAEQEKLAAEKTRQLELTNAERQLRGAFTI